MMKIGIMGSLGERRPGWIAMDDPARVLRIRDIISIFIHGGPAALSKPSMGG
jgi:hypothetical protein